MALGLSSLVHRPAVSYIDLCNHAGKKNGITIFVRLCLIRDLSQMYPCVPLVPLPAVAVGVFLCPVCLWHWQDAAGVIHVMHWCVQSWGDTPHPFWEALTLNTKGLDCLSSAAPTSHSNRIDIDPETRSLQSILPHYFVRVLKCGQVRLHPWRTLLFSNPAGLTSSDKWCDGK